MSSYRRVEPAFCRGCGKPWTPSADVCPMCGEALAAAQVATGDPRALPRFRAAVVVGLLLVTLRWISFGLFPEYGPEVNPEWSGILIAPALIALLTARWWFPGGWKPVGSRPRPLAVIASILAGVALVALAIFADNGELAIALAGGVPHWIILGGLGLVVEEVVFRGVLYDGVEALGGRTNAALSVTVLSALMSLSPLFAVSAAAAALARAWSGSLVPALALRITWVVGLGLATAGFLTY